MCDKHDPEYFPKFKQWCDDYFLIKHRNERRGCGGIFFDDLNNKDADSIFAFSEDCQKAVVSQPCSTAILSKHMQMQVCRLGQSQCLNTKHTEHMDAKQYWFGHLGEDVASCMPDMYRLLTFLLLNIHQMLLGLCQEPATSAIAVPICICNCP